MGGHPRLVTHRAQGARAEAREDADASKESARKLWLS